MQPSQRRAPQDKFEAAPSRRNPVIASGQARYFELVTDSPRCYKLQPEIRTLVVNAMIRLSGLKFEKVVKRSPRLGDSQYFLGEDSHNLVLER